MWEEVTASRLPDKRLRARLGRMVERISQGPHRSLPEIFGTWGETKAAYRFLDNERVTHAELVKGQSMGTSQRIASRREAVVLLVQDSSDFDFSQHRGTEGMGRLENEHMSGFVVHSTLAVSSQGVPLGLVEQQVWVRDEESVGKRHQRHERPFEEKESYKWVTGLPKEQPLDMATQWITVCDREADIYLFFEAVLSRHMDFIVRATRERELATGHDKLAVWVRKQPVQQTYTLILPRRPERGSRPATVELRYSSLTLKAP